MTTQQATAAPDADAEGRVHAVRQRYARRGDRATVRGRAYILYLAALFGAFYLNSAPRCGASPETWRGLRDELTLAPLFGEWWGGTLARTLAWPVVAVTAGVCLGGGLATVTRWPHHGAPPAHTVLLAAGSVVLVLGARFLREMKLHLPLELLLPIITPLGDLSGLRVVAWQFDGLVAVVIGIAVMNAVPSSLVATALAVGVAACCVWTGLRRTGWAHRGLFSRLGRV